MMGSVRWRRVEFLCHDISVHVPHHVNAKIPWYNLRAATDSLREVGDHKNDVASCPRRCAWLTVGDGALD